LQADHVERIETRHLELWTGEGSPALVVLVWSAETGEFRARTARNIRAELDRVKPDWPRQQTVSVYFRAADVLARPDVLRLKEAVLEETDTLGGRTRFHARRRRGLLLDLVVGTVATSHKIEAVGAAGDAAVFESGPGWQSGEIDPADVFAPRVLRTALLLYEEVWVPLDLIGVALRVVPPELILSLVERSRLVPSRHTRLLGRREMCD
jgi:hypothetical protein